MSAGSTKAIALALTANGGIAISKFAVFLLTGSSSLLTEAIHSTADCANQALEGWSLRGAMQAAEPERRGRPLFRYMRQSSSTELVVVLAEDIAALLGLVFALAAVLLTLFTGNPVWDGVGSVTIGLLLIAVAAFVGVEVTSLLMNEAPPLALRAAIRAAVDEDPAVDRVLNLVAVIVGSERLMVALQVKFREQPSGASLVEAIDALERNLHGQFPQIQHLFVEPDVEG